MSSARVRVLVHENSLETGPGANPRPRGPRRARRSHKSLSMTTPARSNVVRVLVDEDPGRRRRSSESLPTRTRTTSEVERILTHEDPGELGGRTNPYPQGSRRARRSSESLFRRVGTCLDVVGGLVGEGFSALRLRARASSQVRVRRSGTFGTYRTSAAT